MGKKTAYVVSGFMLLVISAGEVYSYKNEPYIRPEHTPEMSYSAPAFSMKPVLTQVTSSASTTGVF